MTSWLTIPLFIFALKFSVGCFQTVSLEAVTPVFLGYDVNMFCNASEFNDCCYNTRRWSRTVNKTETVLILEGVSAFPEKFTEIVHSDGFRLILRKLNKSDISFIYTCAYGFHTSNQTLKERNSIYCTNTGITEKRIYNSSISAIIGLIIIIFYCL
ncbi:uncharacterized protein LOC134683582 [Mytilus trossulus]|uniref:uncharacterized protein LOC134683582 n=1 Tax=Mytilus trossulus TaxID=6551 RepID=UPI0030061B0A